MFIIDETMKARLADICDVLSGADYPDGTYNLETLEPMTFKTGSLRTAWTDGHMRVNLTGLPKSLGVLLTKRRPNVSPNSLIKSASGTGAKANPS